MNTKMLDNMIRADKGQPMSLAIKIGVKPIYFDSGDVVNVSKFHDEMIMITSQMWTYMGYSGLMTPWHENLPKEMLRFQDKSLRKWIEVLNEMDVSVRAYCILICIVSSYDKFERPALLFGQRAHWSWMRKLRAYADSRERVDDVAEFMMELLRLQIEYCGKVVISRNKMVGPDNKGKGKAFVVYHNIVDRLNQLEKSGVDYKVWMRAKFKNCCDFKPGEPIYVRTITNMNGLEPDLSKLSAMLSDPWREIKEFLGLPSECEIPDGFIPKGWAPASEDMADLSKVTKVKGDGFYYYKDGTQRRGKRHYASNRYYIIKCDPSNFKFFKDNWDNARLLAAKPTWDEYRQWAMFPHVWDKDGNSLRMTRPVKWRKK